MQRKIIWIIVLIFGTLISQYSCKKIVDKSHYLEFYYVNNSNKIISITAFYRNPMDNVFLEKTYVIPVNGDLFQEIELLFGGNTTEVIAFGDSVTVKFDNIKCSHFLPSTESTYNILNPNNYEFLSKAENRKLHTYMFTEEDYENAVNCD